MIRQAANAELYKGIGCDACFNTGYSGRTGVFEIMGMTDPLRDAILSGKTNNELLDLAVPSNESRQLLLDRHHPGGEPRIGRIQDHGHRRWNG